jgi:putative 4-mercaptohistidine N1-methyltranferase
MSFYESERALAEYLLFHYGAPDQILPHPKGPLAALEFPARCVSECVRFASLPGRARALDLGCAVGRSTFELGRHFTEVTGADLSARFIAAAAQLARVGRMFFDATVEGRLTRTMEAVVPSGIDRGRVRFRVADALNLPADLGSFDLVLAANLIDRLPRPGAFLRQLAGLVRPGGQAVVISPYTWLEEFTPESEWLGGRLVDGRPVRSGDALRSILDPDFVLLGAEQLSFLIREHERKYQWSVAEATIWQRR